MLKRKHCMLNKAVVTALAVGPLWRILYEKLRRLSYSPGRLKWTELSRVHTHTRSLA